MFFNRSAPPHEATIASLKEALEKAEAENVLLRHIAAFSQEEIVVVVGSGGTIVHQNALADTMVKDPTRLAANLHEGMESITLDGCNGIVQSKRLDSEHVCLLYTSPSPRD